MSEDNLRNNFVGIKFSSNEHLDLTLACKGRGVDKSEFIREAVFEKLQRENGGYLKKQEKELLESLEQNRKQQELLGKKKTDRKKIPKKELLWLLETKEMIERSPEFVDGRLNLYTNKFPKPYKTTKQDLFKLMEEAEIQSQEKQILKELEVAQ